MQDQNYKTTPYWWEAAPPEASSPELQIDTHCDVAIVGAGYAGLCAALHLARGGRHVQVFDAEALGWGASSRNGGMTSGNIRPGAQQLKRAFGAERAARIAAEGHDARAFMQDFFTAEGIDCDYQPVGRFYGALTGAEYDGLARQADDLAKEAGIATWAVPRGEVKKHVNTDLYLGGTVRMDIGGVHPAKMQRELIRIARAAGVKIHGECRVRNIIEGTDSHMVFTDKARVKAKEVIICTNGYTDHSDRWLRQRLVMLRSRIIATEDLGEARVKELVPQLQMLTDTRAMTYYYRPSPDGRRILFGGRDTGTFGADQAPTQHNLNELLRIFPQLEGIRVSHSWAGKVAMNRDVIPRIFNRRGLHYATGFCGSGVVWAPWIGKKIAQKLLNQPGTQSAFDFRPPGMVPTWRGRAWFMPAFFAVLGRKDQKALKLGSAEKLGSI